MIHNLRGSAGLNAVGSFPVKRPPYAQFIQFSEKEKRETIGHAWSGAARARRADLERLTICLENWGMIAACVAADV